MLVHVPPPPILGSQHPLVVGAAPFVGTLVKLYAVDRDLTAMECSL